MQFRRFAGCPLCNLHLRSIVRRHDEIAAAGVREVVMFHSTAEELREHTAGLPFAVVAGVRAGSPDDRLPIDCCSRKGLASGRLSTSERSSSGGPRSA